ncbi:putative ribonuclease H protein [Vitis vinifera]|uniref:Putative ribonuclease H protein n=1 Tax=Vitis vinifera TaxID=29760 RepID=A0A438J9S0_VITVI|nr:putative ribonuclease H protein [Vitis vinifera]
MMALRKEKLEEHLSRLRTNLCKSTLSGINISNDQTTRPASLLDYVVSKWPLTYLGLPLRRNPNSFSFWEPVLDRVSSKLDGWKKAFLSLGGRITLIQSSLTHIPSYFLSLFKIPISIALRIEKLQRDFLWSRSGEGKRDHLASWDIVYRPKEFGGLGCGKITLRNQAFLQKWLWKYPLESFALWHQVILSIYGTHPNGWDANNIVRWSHRCPWKDVIFRRNPTNVEIKDLERLMSLLSHVHLTPILDRKLGFRHL